mmetsp:Transcript_6593/g.19407  ORF Transcript_6593/g.19407 Transcript_6593/m.19407 type:complete len:223 (-) Transcript_6593:216-884(-)
MSSCCCSFMTYSITWSRNPAMLLPSVWGTRVLSWSSLSLILFLLLCSAYLCLDALRGRPLLAGASAPPTKFAGLEDREDPSLPLPDLLDPLVFTPALACCGALCCCCCCCSSCICSRVGEAILEKGPTWAFSAARGVPGLDPFSWDTACHHCWNDTGSMAAPVMARGEGTSGDIWILVGAMAAPDGITASGLTSWAPVTGIVLTIVMFSPFCTGVSIVTSPS